MFPWLLLTAALAADPVPAETVEDTAATEAQPWREYRVRNVLHPELDLAFLDTWEPVFRRRNRMAGIGAGIMIGGAGLLVSGVMIANRGAPAGPTQAFVGGAAIITGPILAIHGTLGAASILRASGIRVRRGWAWASIGLLSSAIFGFTAPFVVPLSAVAALAQADRNHTAFAQAMGRSPRPYVAVVPTVRRDGGTLALQGRW